MFKQIRKMLRRRRDTEITAEEAERLREAEMRMQAHALLRRHTITPEEYEELLRK